MSTSATSRNAVAFAGTALAVALLLAYPTSTDSGGRQRRPGQAAAPPGIVGATATPATGSGANVINGSSYGTRYGPVQVQITVSAGRITKATAIDYPQGSGRDQEINRVAIPQLDAEVVQAQSAHLDAVSGATYTSEGYVGSLQAALDAAHLP
jgi:uncharacterized protein with FMN-binding domain